MMTHSRLDRLKRSSQPQAKSPHVLRKFFKTAPERSKRVDFTASARSFRPGFRVDRFQGGRVLTAPRKVLFQFFVPNELVLVGNEARERRQRLTAQLFHSFFYFG